MNCCIAGAGAWGTAFAVCLAKQGHAVALLPRRREHAETISRLGENRDYLPGIPLPSLVRVDAEPASALRDADVVILACPAQALRETARRLSSVPGFADKASWVVSLSKGLETESHYRPSQIISQELPKTRACALTGPTNAAEVARGLPAAMVLASGAHDQPLTALQASLSSPTLRVYTSEDLAGVEFGGCLKNIYAIAAGCCDGLKLGDNAKAAMLTRALAEMVRVGVALGARAETFYGLSGFGDLVATCHGGWSRNRDFGQKLGEGSLVSELISNRKTVVEGYRTAESFFGLCQEKGIDAPILSEVYRVCFQGRQVREAIYTLMTRELKKE